MPNWLIADIIVIVHFVWVAFVVLAVPAVIVGALLRRRFVHNSWFRNVHLLMIGIVVAESICGVTCPLTAWEDDFRLVPVGHDMTAVAGDGSAGEPIAEPRQYGERSFIGHWVHELLFFDFPEWVFTTTYIVFGLLVAGLYIVVPPRCLSRWLGRSPNGVREPAAAGSQ